MSRVVGIDLDNTLIDYGDLFHQVAADQGLLSGSGDSRDKASVRRSVRGLPDGEAKWQRVQAVVYSEQLPRARPFAGVTDFLQRCRQQAIPVWIISHKTEFPSSRQVPAVNLREAAVDWLDRQGWLDSSSSALVQRERVLFFGTRAEKLDAIGRHGCDYYIDDLLEVLIDAAFPSSTSRILFSPSGEPAPTGVSSCSTWDEVARRVFGDGAPPGGRV